ncbi:isoleucine--tRNA ligase [Syntrophomonas wolfei]|uniref:Isoleucine--tRNA ligase n=2 Tax=Syntrophomonas wolfei TaxID=863 RepID=SYI_SYNWW|nr:isoleucine--tRNA ligase [Syntrophomonas wolfei]Q0AYC7.1 RecName: Full=Isoleucine--tRNA ligase; AltName: Full=Isoleucyl-tRNA synthetase; Short=IleRS [Syntrophomonas wolfei subsp. wolfei str. Goettingen G311]ABI68277.1 Isoleucyl-tRNA synthetase [Syntrophomonas wolfei subsp. wolfei str. Goettingen G311]
MAKGKYDGTLNLPQTGFPMRANLPQREPEILKFWDEIDIYRRIQEKNAGRPQFILHDGPPYANGNIHLGHTLNKVLKDIIVKYRSMSGYDSPYIPGWDTHGLPIEQQAIKNLGIDRHKTDVVEFREHCRDYALKYVEIQKEQFKRLGVRGDWEDPYLTLSPGFESIQIKVFGEMAKKGFIYKGLKPVYWCGDCETALAEAEVEYNEKVSPSIYVKFPVKDGKGVLPEDAFVIIWTTTPWTLPANTGICLHPGFDYVLLEVKGEKYLLAQGLLEAVAGELGWDNYQILDKYKGEELERVICHHPFFARDSLLVLGEHVTLEAGTGCVHTAPGHGEDDFHVGQEYGLEVISPVDDRGRFTAEAEKFQGLYVHDANKAVIEELEKRNMLLKAASIEHQYPYCWRCKQPIIYRATEQWFASIDGFRQDALNAIDTVKWIPSWGRDRIFNMIRDRGDWCISRQRTWGVPIPIFYCESCGEALINDETIQRVSELFAANGSDIWFAKTAAELMPPGCSCEHCGGSTFRKESDIMDVWFDSGSSHMAVLEPRQELRWPSDMYLEGSDQHRGWFNSSLSTAVAIRGAAPYREVLTHGFVVDEQGRKMSKSLGNVVDPLRMTREMGADILRLWVSSADYRNDVSVSPNIIKQSAEAYRKIRNTCRFILGNLFDFDPGKERVSYDKLSELDQWALLKLDKLIRRVTKAYEDYEFHVVFHSMHNFCTVDLSNIYFDILKDKLYCSHPQDAERKAAQTVLYDIINALVVMLTPILAFSSEEIWSYLKKEGQAESVQLLEWPQANDEYLNQAIENRMSRVLELREVVTKALEEARSKKVIGHSLGAWITIYASPEWTELLKATAGLEKIFIVSRAELKPETEAPAEALALEGVEGIRVMVQAAEGSKCERCWIIENSVGEDLKHPTLCQRCAEVVAQLQG